jgi:hypothetical protein
VKGEGDDGVRDVHHELLVLRRKNLKYILFMKNSSIDLRKRQLSV